MWPLISVGWNFVRNRTVIPGDRRETRDPFRSLSGKRSGMDPGSALRFARDDGAHFVEVEVFENKNIMIGQTLRMRASIFTQARKAAPTMEGSDSASGNLVF